MEKLELKHIAPYLPYDLKINVLNYKSDYVGQRIGVVKGHYFIGDTLYLTYMGGSTGKSQNECLIMLRPLSDLTKEIDCPVVMGEKIVPFSQLSIKLYDREPESFDAIEYCKNWLENHLATLNEEKGYDNVLHWIYQDLIKWHFDVFGLINKGLAVDINTIES